MEMKKFFISVNHALTGDNRGLGCDKIPHVPEMSFSVKQTKPSFVVI
jgi:hypothetical protein